MKLTQLFNRNFLTIIVLTLLVGAASPTLAQQGRGTLKGKVLLVNGQAAENITISLKDTRLGTVTDEDGNFEFKAPAGNYTLVASHVAAQNIETAVDVTAGQTTQVPNIVINVKLSALQQVDILDNRNNKFTRKKSEYVAKMPLTNIENPQVYNTVTSQLIKDQVITSFNDALKNAPGVDKLWTSTGRGGDGAGYFSLRGFAVQPTMLNGLPGLTNGGLDVANIDRIEVIKGPSGALFGSTLVSYGGLINIATKKPLETFRTELSYTTGSFGLNRLTADVNTPLDKDGKVLLRVNAAYHDQNSFQDAGFIKTRFFAPTLSYKVDDKLSFLFLAEILSSEGTNPAMLFLDRGTKLRVNTIEELGYDPKKSYTSNNLTIKNPTSLVQGQMNYRFNNNWTSQTVLSRSSAKSLGYYSYLYEVSQYMPGYPNISSTFGRYISDQNSTTSTFDIQQNFNGDIKTGSIRHRILVGLDYFSRNVIDNGTGYAAIGMVDMKGNDSGTLSKQYVDSTLTAQPTTNSNVQQQVYSAYASDVINFTPQFSAMLSLRVDHFNTGGLTAAAADKYSQTALSPKFGLVYQPIEGRLSVFANYMNGFTNVAPARTNTGQVITFKPEHANQWEAGVKVNLLDKLAATVSYYDIKVSDKVRTLGPNEFVQDGQNYSRGFEADITANPITGLNIIAGYSHNNSQVTKTDADDYRGRRPEEAGPVDMVNAWISYRISSGSVKGLGFGFGGNYASKNQILNRLTTGTFALPAYTVLNSSVSYSASAWTLTLKVNNLTNKQYYKGWSTIEAQMPRAFVGSIAFKF